MKQQVPAAIKYTISIYLRGPVQVFKGATALENVDHMTWFKDSEGKLHAFRGNFHAIQESQ